MDSSASVPSWLKNFLAVFTENDLWAYLSFGLVFTLAWLGLWILKKLICSRLRALSRKTRNNLDDFVVDLVDHTKTFFLVAVSLYVSIRFLTLPEVLVEAVGKLLVLSLLLQLWFWGAEALNFAIQSLIGRDRQVGESDEAIRGTMPALVFVGRLILLSLIFLLALDNFGFDVTALVASLGVGGIAVALAVQNILGDLFASLSILLDKPFKVGDFVVVNEFSGTVEKIGLKTTRVRSLSGEQLVFSNNDLLSSRIRNYQQMNERRIVFGFGVIYQTSSEKLRRIPQIVEEIISAQEHARFDRAHFRHFGASSLDFEVVFFVLRPDYLTFMNVQQAINQALFERFEKEGIVFAYPTQSLFIEQWPGDVTKTSA